MPKYPQPPITSHTSETTALLNELPRPVTLRPIEDITLLEDLRAAAHLKRTTPKALVADIIRTHLGPKFAPHVAAA